MAASGDKTAVSMEAAPIPAGSSPPPRPWRPSLKKNIAYSALGQGFLLVLQLFSIRSVYTGLGHDAFGIIAFCQMVAFLTSTFLDKTTRFALVKEIAQSSDRSHVLPFVRAFGTLSTGLFVALGMLFLAVAPAVTHGWIELGSLNPESATFAIRVLGVVAASAVLKSFLTSILIGQQRHGYYNLVESVSQTVLQLGLIIVIYFTASLTLVVYWSLLHAVVTLAVYALLCGRFLGAGYLNPLSSLRPLRKSIGFKANLLVGSMLGALQKRFDTIILSKLLPIGELGLYAALFNLASKSNLPTVAIGQAAYPSFSSIFAKNDMQAMQAKYRAVNDIAVITSLLTVGFLMFAGKPLLHFLFGEQTALRLLPTFIMVLVGFLLSSLVSVPWIISLAAGRPDITTWSNLASLAFIPLSFVLISKFSLHGAGASWILYNLTYCMFAVPRICRDCLAMPSRHWFRNVGAYMLCASLTYGLSWWWLLFTAKNSWLPVALTFAAATAAFAAASYFIVISGESRQTLLSLWRRVRPPRPGG